MGKRCTMVMQEDRPLERAFGGAVGTHVRGLLESRGIEVLGGEDVVGLEGEERVATVVTASGRRVDADLVVVGVGATPDVMLARAAGLELGETGGIRCDARLATSAPGIFAAGDVCEYDSVIHGRRLRVEHEEHAMAQGRTAARNLLGQEVEHREVPYFWTDLADWLTLEYVGPADGWDQELLSGSFDDGAFTLWYAQGGRVVAALSAGRPGGLDDARALIAEGAPVERLGDLDDAPVALDAGVAR
jgi:3-phenylpropionate/trans-cinnamate dioxygenase ferredoxin reductase subunit